MIPHRGDHAHKTRFQTGNLAFSMVNTHDEVEFTTLNRYGLSQGDKGKHERHADFEIESVHL